MEEDIISVKKKSKKDITINKIRWKYVFSIFALALLFSFLYFFQFLRDNNLSWKLWFEYIILIIMVQVSIWRRIALWLRYNEERIFPRTLEYFFFIFIFLSSYLLCFLIDNRFPLGIVSSLFVFSAISAAYCGELYFLEGISDSRTKKEIKITYDVGEIRHYDERMFILAYYIVFIPSIFILYLKGVNSEFLRLLSLPVILFIFIYWCVFYLTEGEYYKNSTDYIKLKSWVYILLIFIGLFFSNFILNIFPIDIQINNFIETFL